MPTIQQFIDCLETFNQQYLNSQLCQKSPEIKSEARQVIEKWVGGNQKSAGEPLIFKKVIKNNRHLCMILCCFFEEIISLAFDKGLEGVAREMNTIAQPPEYNQKFFIGSAILYAVAEEKIPFVVEFLAEHSEVVRINVQPILHQAIVVKSLHLLDLIIKCAVKGRFVHAIMNYRYRDQTPLTLAIDSDALPAVKMLLPYAINSRKKAHQDLLADRFLEAVYEENTALVKVLGDFIEEKKLWDNIDRANHLGERVLHTAARNGYEEILEILLSYRGLCANDASYILDKNDGKIYLTTPLHLAAAGGHLAMVQCLVRHGAIIEAVQQTKNILPLSQEGYQENFQSLVGSDQERLIETPCQVAAMNGHTQVMNYLMGMAKIATPFVLFKNPESVVPMDEDDGKVPVNPIFPTPMRS